MLSYLLSPSNHAPNETQHTILIRSASNARRVLFRLVSTELPEGDTLVPNNLAGGDANPSIPLGYETEIHTTKQPNWRYI
jgi:hypothetical protein